MPVFYAHSIDESEATLGEEESRHLVRVLRLGEKDKVDLVDGRGNLYIGIILSADPGCTKVLIQETRKGHLVRPFHLHLAIAPTKSNERFEWFLEKATEIGIEEITPILCERSEREKIRPERSEKILLSAMKQSGRALLPRLNPMIPMSRFLETTEGDRKYLAHCGILPGTLPAKPLDKGLSWIVMIGPEGDFSPAEIQLATEHDYLGISLGEAVLRTETAGVAACQLISFLNQ